MQEAILLELRNMNDDVASNRKDGDVHNSDMFQKHYATLLLQIKEVNQQVCHSLAHGSIVETIILSSIALTFG